MEIETPQKDPSACTPLSYLYVPKLIDPLATGFYTLTSEPVLSSATITQPPGTPLDGLAAYFHRPASSPADDTYLVCFFNGHRVWARSSSLWSWFSWWLSNRQFSMEIESRKFELQPLARGRTLVLLNHMPTSDSPMPPELEYYFPVSRSAATAFNVYALFQPTITVSLLSLLLLAWILSFFILFWNSPLCSPT